MNKIAMPRLTETAHYTSPYMLPVPRVCHICGGDGTPGELTVWQEHDDDDRREMRFVVLCPRCSDRLIEAHPRLYRRMHRNEPAPGVMVQCFDCASREGIRCISPEMRANGGPGVAFAGPDSTMHLLHSGPRPRGRWGEWVKVWDREPACPARKEGPPT